MTLRQRILKFLYTVHQTQKWDQVGIETIAKLIIELPVV